MRWANSIPPIVVAAFANVLNPAIDAQRRLVARWSCSIMLLRYLFVRTFTSSSRSAGDFAGINEIDLLLGVCQASVPYYAHLLVDKMLYMVPEEQARLKEIMRYRSVLDEFLLLVDEHSGAPWFQANARLFLEICDLFAVTARQHHNELVARFIEKPSKTLDDRHLTGITASGPPLQSLINSPHFARFAHCGRPLRYCHASCRPCAIARRPRLAHAAPAQIQVI
jgi:Domain of unknown function (DUF1864)